jgi:drug/metabolite transporter (DMT)-like permease
VGSFFIPFVNLVVPYRAVKDVWQKSGPPDEALVAEPDPPALFPVWWLFWLLAAFAGNISFRMSFNENVSYNTAITASIFADALFIIAAVFAYLVVDSIDKKQEETSARLRLGKFAAPPPPPANLMSPDVVAPAITPNN